MNLDKQIWDLLYEIDRMCLCFCDVPECDGTRPVGEAIAKIKALVVESLPKEKPAEPLDDTEDEQFYEEIGYNQCLGEIRSIFE